MKNWENLKCEGIKIGAIKYSVKDVNEIEINNEQCGGSCDYNEAIIEISSVVGNGAKAKFLIHEVLHGLLHSRGLHEINDNEDIVDELAEGLILLIQDNPTLVDFVKTSSDLQG